jgi:hypothetical protein
LGLCLANAPTNPGAPTANLDGGLKLQQIGLAHENLLGGEAQHADFILCQLHLLAWAPIPDVQQALNDLINLPGTQRDCC